MEPGTGTARSTASDRLDALAQVVALVLVGVPAFMVLRALWNPVHLVIVLVVLVAVVVFSLLGVHMALISLNGLLVSEDYFVSPHEGFPGIFSGMRKPIPHDDVAGAELLESSTGRLSVPKVNLLNRNLLVLKEGTTVSAPSPLRALSMK